MFKKFLTATLVAASFSVSAMAQSITESDATNIMDNYRSGFNALSINLCLDRNKQSLTGRDLQQAFTLKQNEVVQLLNRGDRTMAAGKASTMLNAFGHCYGKSVRQTDREIYAGFMGGFIATQALTYGDDGKMQKAITLLDYAKSHGQTNTQFLNLVKEHRTKEALWLVAETSESTSCNLTEDQFDKVYEVNKGESITVQGNVKAVEAIASGNGFYLKTCKVI